MNCGWTEATTPTDAIRSMSDGSATDACSALTEPGSTFSRSARATTWSSAASPIAWMAALPPSSKAVSARAGITPGSQRSSPRCSGRSAYGDRSRAVCPPRLPSANPFHPPKVSPSVSAMRSADARNSLGVEAITYTVVASSMEGAAFKRVSSSLPPPHHIGRPAETMASIEVIPAATSSLRVRLT